MNAYYDSSTHQSRITTVNVGTWGSTAKSTPFGRTITLIGFGELPNRTGTDMASAARELYFQDFGLFRRTHEKVKQLASGSRVGRI